MQESICRTSLQRAEEELSKESGLNPVPQQLAGRGILEVLGLNCEALVLELVKRVGHYNPGSVDDLRSSL